MDQPVARPPVVCNVGKGPEEAILFLRHLPSSKGAPNRLCSAAFRAQHLLTTPANVGEMRAGAASMPQMYRSLR